VDFSWIKDLAESANKNELDKAAQFRQDKASKREEALAAAPLVERICMLMTACCDEFNKHVAYQHLRIVCSRVKRRKTGIANSDDPELTYAEENTYFTFSRGSWTCGFRGVNGAVEFVELPGVSDGGSMDFKFDEASVAPSRRLVARQDPTSKQIVWLEDDRQLDGQAIVALCKDCFRSFIEKTQV
jgi:hypothetical protein